LSGRAERTPSSDERLAGIIEPLDRDFQNYSDSVLILNGLREFFSAIDAPARFIGTNLPLRRLDALESQPPRPDLVLQSIDQKIGYCLELKWSISKDSMKLEKEVSDTIRYSQPRKGWKTSDGRVETVEAFLIAPRDDCTNILKVAESDGSIKGILERSLTLLSWDFSRTKTPSERLYVSRVCGPPSSLDSCFASPGLQLPTSVMTDTLAKVLFYGADPPIAYSMEKVYILANASKGFETLSDVEIRSRTTRYFKEGILVSARELHSQQATFFSSWERTDQDVPQLRLSWIQNSLTGLSRIGMAIPVVAMRAFSGSGAVFLKASRPGWENNSSQLFFIPSRSRGMGLRQHIIHTYARYLLHVEERKYQTQKKRKRSK
jgi:hypothetical protein